MQQFSTGQLCYWLLNSHSSDVVERNKRYLFFRFLICNSRRGSFSTCFTLLKLKSKGSIKQKHSDICHLYGMIFCFETENTMTYMAYFSLVSFFFFFFLRLLCRRSELKNEFCISYSSILFQQLTTGQLYYWL